ncbi:hypothetical protein CLM62_43240 [Streptomyces sp. SA15]|nr:hypothetical protein CLM62_43240 [Streptomyces sp. SA15]
MLAMARVHGRVFTRRGLPAQVWGEDFFGDERVMVLLLALAAMGGRPPPPSPSCAARSRAWPTASSSPTTRVG